MCRRSGVATGIEEWGGVGRHVSDSAAIDLSCLSLEIIALPTTTRIDPILHKTP